MRSALCSISSSRTAGSRRSGASATHEPPQRAGRASNGANHSSDQCCQHLSHHAVLEAAYQVRVRSLRSASLRTSAPRPAPCARSRRHPVSRARHRNPAAFVSNLGLSSKHVTAAAPVQPLISPACIAAQTTFRVVALGRFGFLSATELMDGLYDWRIGFHQLRPVSRGRTVWLCCVRFTGFRTVSVTDASAPASFATRRKDVAARSFGLGAFLAGSWTVCDVGSRQLHGLQGLAASDGCTGPWLHMMRPRSHLPSLRNCLWFAHPLAAAERFAAGGASNGYHER
jgi:hypothetical protein